MQLGVLGYRKSCPQPCGKSADLSQESDPPGRGEVCDGWHQHDRSHLRRQPLASKLGGFPPSRYGLVVGSCGSRAALTTDRGSRASRDWGGVLAVLVCAILDNNCSSNFLPAGVLAVLFCAMFDKSCSPNFLPAGVPAIIPAVRPEHSCHMPRPS